MKKLFAAITALCMVLPLAACGGDNSDNVDDNNAPVEDAADLADPADLAADIDAQAYWNGDWYGWWTIDNCSEAYAPNENARFDAFAIFTIDDDNTGLLEIWDEDNSRNEPIGYVEVSLNAQDNIVSSESGTFMYGELSSGEWTIDPSESRYDDMLIIEGDHVDDDGSYSYTMYLRPWGMLWDDVATDYPEAMPAYYDDWYLPLVEAGAEMPETMAE